MSISRIAHACLDALLPQRCMLCGASHSADPVCTACATDLPRLIDPACPICALPTPDGKTCGACLKRAPAFDATHALFAYAFPVDKLIQALKYSRRLASADFLARHLAALQGDLLPDLIIPVPLSRRRLAERGFNQAHELSRALAARPGHRQLPNIVERVTDTPPLTGLPYKERRKHIRHAFECRVDLGASSVLVVDDVMTTGATLNELATVLKRHGAARVDNLVVARTIKD